MRNRALSVLRARQMIVGTIIYSPTNDCWNNHLFDVNSRDFGATPRNRNSCTKGWDHRIGSLLAAAPRQGGDPNLAEAAARCGLLLSSR